MYADPEFAAGLANYQELSTAFAARCRARRNAEEEQREELAELTKPAPASDVCKSNGAGAIIRKVRDDACIADDNAGASVERTSRNVTARDVSQMPWTDWVDRRLEDRLCEFGEQVTTATGGAMAEYVASRLDPVRRDLELTRRELTVLRQEVAVERGLKALREEVETARAEMPKLPAIVDEFEAEQKQLRAKQVRLEHELAATKDKLSNLRVDQGLDHHAIRQLEKTASKATASIEMETSVARFALHGIHPEAAKALREFASQVVDAEDGGAIWGRCTEATARTA